MQLDHLNGRRCRFIALVSVFSARPVECLLLVVHRQDTECYRHIPLYLQLSLRYVIDAYRDLGLGDRFFTPMFEKLVGAGWVRGMIVAGASEEAIRARWVPDVERYREKRVQYLLYE